MKLALFVLVCVAGLTSAACLSQPADGQKAEPVTQSVKTDRAPVVVELFTSEGCSSCPPADRALKFLGEQQPVSTAEIIPLAFHVDYWDHLGWKDRFSSAAYTRRQELYVQRFGIESSYTPEMVVDGRTEFIGNDTGRASSEIAKSAAVKKGTVKADLDGNLIDVSIAGLPEHHPATVFLAIAESGITSNVKAGENGGSTFNHSSVVRSLTTLGLIEKDVNEFQVKGSLPEIADWKRENSKIVVFVQDNVNRRIIAAGLAENGKQTD